MRLSAALFLAACACTLAACDPPAPREALRADDVREQAQALASISAEADLLAQQLAAHRVSGAFAWVHQQALAQDAGQAAARLARPAPESLRPAQQRALQLAAGLQERINRLAQARGEPASLLALRREFVALKSQATGLEGSP